MQFLKIIDATGLFRSLMAILCSMIYSIMGFCYDLFNNLSQVDILTSKDVQPIYQRVTMIITIVMIFYVTFQFVKYVVQPEGMADKEKGAGKLVYKIVMVIVLIAFVPRIFQIAYNFQKKIIESNVISNVILGPHAVDSEENLGSAFASSVFNMFYYVEEENINKNCHDGIDCGVLVNKNIGELKNDGKIKNIQVGLNETDSADNYLITFEFHGLIAVIVGGFICYILILYCIDVGVRWAQLLYLQLIAPIPIIGYMSPKKDGMFQKWLKQCTTTYLDLFFRVAIINIILLLCDTLIKSRIAGEIAPDGSTWLMSKLIYVVLIMGVLLFAHKAPKLLAELFPKGGAASGNFGLKATERVAPEAARVAGAALGSTRLLGGAVGRAVRTAQRNINNGHNIFTKRGREAIAESREKRRAARTEYRQARHDLRDARRDYNRTTSQTDNGEKSRFEKAQDTFNQKRNEVADLKNKQYRSVAGSALVGGIQGAWQGATTGAKATKLEDIGKQVKAGYKKNEDAINAHEKYMNAGGSGGISGFIDRGITSVESSLGIPTRASKIEQEIKNYDDQIKEQKQIAAVEGSIIQSSDKATDANVKKIEDGKLKQKVVSGTEAALANELGLAPGEVRAGQTLTDIYQNIKSVAASKRSYADQLSKKLADDPLNVTLKQDAEAAQKAAVQAEQNVKKATKKMGEYTNTVILNDPNRKYNSNYEAGAVIAIDTALQRLKDASSQPDTMQRLNEHLSHQNTNDLPAGKSVSDLIEYMNNPDTIDDFAILDYLGKSLGTISSTRESDTKEIENAKNRVASGAYKAEITANVDYNNAGNGGKK